VHVPTKPSLLVEAIASAACRLASGRGGVPEVLGATPTLFAGYYPVGLAGVLHTWLNSSTCGYG
jgi:hypothetical protein